jgi:hypothetical protein
VGGVFRLSAALAGESFEPCVLEFTITNSRLERDMQIRVQEEMKRLRDAVTQGEQEVSNAFHQLTAAKKLLAQTVAALQRAKYADCNAWDRARFQEEIARVEQTFRESCVPARTTVVVPQRLVGSPIYLGVLAHMATLETPEEARVFSFQVKTDLITHVLTERTSPAGRAAADELVKRGRISSLDLMMPQSLPERLPHIVPAQRSSWQPRGNPRFAFQLLAPTEAFARDQQMRSIWQTVMMNFIGNAIVLDTMEDCVDCACLASFRWLSFRASKQASKQTLFRCLTLWWLWAPCRVQTASS